MRFILLRLLWRVLIKAVAVGSWHGPYHLYRRMRCDGTAATWCDMGGYGRYGISRQYCHRFRWHRGRCLAPVDDDGCYRRFGAYFTPEEGR